MASDRKTGINYELLQQVALRGVVRAALQQAASPRGLPGDHHFYISFRTSAPGVIVPEDLRARYPEEMTIVLQNQYWDLKVGETGFSVTLQFNGQPKVLTIPYAMVTRFYDPSVQYLLQFAPVPAEMETPAVSQVAAAVAPSGPGTAPASEGGDGDVKVISLDNFRKR